MNNSMLESLGLSIVHSLWQGAILLFLVLLTLVMLRNKSARLRYSVTLIGTFTLPALLLFNLAFFWPQKLVENSGSSTPSEIRLSPNLSSDFQGIAEIPQSSSTVLWINENASTIALFWVAGMILFLLKVLGSFIWMKRLVHKASYLDGSYINTLLTRVKAVLGINRNLIVKSSSWIKSPVILGFIRPTILFPIGLIEGLTTEEVEAILFHELAHLKRNDFVINIIINVLQIVFFYHPAYWWLKSQLDNEREYATDELALKYSEKKLPMIKALAKVQAFSMNQPALAFAGNSKNQVLKRINTMMNSKQQPNWLSAIFTIAILLVAFGVMSVQDTNPKKEKKDEAPTNGKMLIDLDTVQNLNSGRYLDLDHDSQPQDNDSSAVSKAILEMVNNPKAFIYEFDEKGEIIQITKNGKELRNPELSNYRKAYLKLNTFSQRNNAEVDGELQNLRRTLESREAEMSRLQKQGVQLFLNDAEEIDSILINGQLIEGDQKKRIIQQFREEQLSKASIEQLRNIKSQFEQLRRQIETEQNKGKQIEPTQQKQIQEYRDRIAAIEREINAAQKAAQYNEEIDRALARSEMALPGGEVNRDILKVLLQPFSKKDATTLYILDNKTLNNSKAYEESIEQLKSVQIISGANLESYGPKAKGKNLIIKGSTKETQPEPKIQFENQWKAQAQMTTDEGRKERLLEKAKEIGDSSGKINSLPGGKENRDIITLVILNIDPSYPETVIDYNGNLIEWKELKSNQIEAAKSIQVIAGEALNDYKPKRKIKDKAFIIKLSTN